LDRWIYLRKTPINLSESLILQIIFVTIPRKEMELLTLPSFPCILACLLLLLSFILVHKKRAAHSKSNLPPGPWTLPIIGCLHHLATASLPHRALHNLARLYGPIMLLRAGEIDLVVITSREAAKEVRFRHP
jgi:Cytochrome P450